MPPREHTMQPRQRALYGALALTLALCAGLALWGEDGVVDEAPARVDAVPNRAPSRVALPQPALEPSATRASAAGRPHDGRQGWAPVPRQAAVAWSAGPSDAGAPPRESRPAPPRPAAPASAPVATPAPAAPAAPFRYTGRITEGGQRRALLISPLGTLVVAEKESLDGQWRVDRISDDALLLTWLPGNQPQRLPFAPT